MTITIDTAKLENYLTRVTNKREEAYNEMDGCLFGSKEYEELRKFTRNCERIIHEANRTLPYIGLFWNTETMQIEETVWAKAEKEAN